MTRIHICLVTLALANIVNTFYISKVRNEVKELRRERDVMEQAVSQAVSQIQAKVKEFKNSKKN